MSPTTPNLDLPYPDLQYTADVPRDIQALALKLDGLLGGGGGGGGGGTLPLAAAPVLDVGIPGQVRAGRQLTPADFTSLGLSPPIGLWSLSDLTNQGSDGRPLVNLGAVPFGAGINGLASSCAVFAGSTGQALYISDSGAADPYRIRSGSLGCWFRCAKRGAAQVIYAKWPVGAGQFGWSFQTTAANTVVVYISTTGSDSPAVSGVSDVVDDRWHLVALTSDGTLLRLYVDGVLEASASGGSIFPGSAPLNIGGQAADGSTAAVSPFYGRVDEAFITGDVLTDDQIRLLYATRLAHTLGTIPTTVRLKVHRRRKGAPLAVTDFTTQPVRLHNFTGGALTDQGSGGVALTNNGSAVPVAGADGAPQSAFSFSAASSQSLSATDAGLPGGLTARSYGCWFKTQAISNGGIIGWGTIGTGDARFIASSVGFMQSASGADVINTGFLMDGQWHHMVTVEDNTASDGVRRKLYMDGRLIGGSTVMTPVTLAGANRFRLGANPDGTSLFNGQIDAAFIANYALGATEIRSLYAKGVQDLGGSPKNAGDHVERVDAASVLMIADTLDSQHTIDLGVVA